jgi:hypothetical protein
LFSYVAISPWTWDDDHRADTSKFRRDWLDQERLLGRPSGLSFDPDAKNDRVESLVRTSQVDRINRSMVA